MRNLSASSMNTKEFNVMTSSKWIQAMRPIANKEANWIYRTILYTVYCISITVYSTRTSTLCTVYECYE